LIRLRAVEAGDAAAHHAFNLAMESDLIDMRYPPGSLEREEEWTGRAALKGFERQEYSFQMESLAGELVGGISTHHCDNRVGLVSYGLHVFEEHRKKGYAKEAICLVLRYYFQELRYQKANVAVYAINSPSTALHESLGFQLEGRQRRNVFTRGEFSDLLWFGITVEEFRKRFPEYWLALPE
jgi:RimJ/RimL family protein N-acetyltransferase